MKTPRKQSPARSEGVVRTPIRHKHRRTISVSSARSNASGILSALVHQRRNMDSFVVSPLTSRKSILSDNTDIEEPRRKSWWKNLGENSRDVIELLEENKIVEPNNIIEELDIEVLSQENKNYTMDLPESSGSESISSIVIPQRKLFTQKENLPQKKFGEIIGNRESLAKLHKTNTGFDKTINVGTRELFQNKQRSKPIFPAALLNISPNKTAADKTKELAAIEPKSQVRNIFGNRATKRKNIFTNFIVSESEDEISEIQPKVFGFQKKIEARRRGSSSSRGLREPSPTSSITTDIEMDDWKMLPSSTMVETQLEIMMAGQSPKRARLSKLIEIESEVGSNATKSSKSGTSKEDKSRKSKTFTMEKAPEYQSMNTRNTFRISLDEQEEIFTQNEDVLDKFSITEKSRKSKTFTKEKAPDELMTTKNKSKISQDDDDEEIFDRNRDTEISRKSKTFTKEKGPDSETTMTTRNKSKDVLNKSKSKIVDPNMSQSSMKTRSQSKNNSPNSSQTLKSDAESKTISNSAKNINMLEAQTTIHQENDDDDELNFSLQYDNENEDLEVGENQEVEEPKTQNKSITSKSVSEVNQKENSANISKLNKSLTKKVIEETADLDYSQEKCNRSMKGRNKSQDKHTSNNDQMEINDEEPHNQSNDKSQNPEIEMKNVDESKVEENDIENEEVHEVQQVEKNNEKSETEELNKSEVEDEDKIEEVSVNEEEQNQSENKISQEIEHRVEDKIESEEVEEENEEEIQNESEAQLDQRKLEQNQTLTQEQEDEIEIAQDKSKKNKQDENGIQDNEKQHESDDGQNESAIQETDEHNESDGKKQNKSAIHEIDEQNVSDNEEQNESAVQETDENDESAVQETDEQNESDHELQNESEVIQETDENNESSVEERDEQNECDNEVQNESAIQETDENNESDNEVLNESAVQETDENNESDNDIQNESAVQETDENNESDNEVLKESAVQETDENNESDNEVLNESAVQETDENNENDNEVLNESAVQETDEQNETDNEEQNESAIQETDKQNESDNEEQNESVIQETNENKESDNEEQNVSAIQESDEQNESDNEVQNKSAMSENDEQNESAVLETNKRVESPIQENEGHTKNERKKQDNNEPTDEKQQKNEVAAENASALLAKSNVFFDGTKNSSAEDSGWDSHRTTRKTIRQTYGRELTPRKSLRALVMEKSAKRQTQHNEVASVTNYFPQANSTEMQESNRYDDDDDQENHDVHEVSFRTRQTTLEMYLQEVKKKNAETRLKIEEEVRNSLNAPSKYHIFKVPAKPMFARRTKTVPKPKETAKSTKIFGELPTEFIEDMKYKPPKRFQPRDAPWITKHLYKFLETKLEPKYDYKARVRAEKLVENIYYFAKDLRRRDAATSDSVDVLKREMARLNVVKTHFDFYEFFHQFMPREVRIKVIPDVVNKISLPRHGVFADIL